MQKMQFDPLKDFTYIVCLTGYTFGLVVRADSPIKSVQDLVDIAKAHPETFTYGSPGIGTSPHLAVEEFASKAGIKLQHVPFKGSRGGLAGAAGRAHHGAQRFDGLGRARGRGHRRLAGYLRVQADEKLGERADAKGTGLRDRL